MRPITARSFARPNGAADGAAGAHEHDDAGPEAAADRVAQLVPVTLLCAAGSMKSRSGSTVSLPVTGAPKPIATASSATVATRTRRGCAVTRRAIAVSTGEDRK